MQALRILVLGIGLHSVEGNPEERARFRESMQQISDRFVDELSPEDLLDQAGSILEALDHHNRNASRQIRAQATELQNMLKMLTSTIGVISSVSDVHVNHLNEIEKQIARAGELDDVRAIRARLTECLTDIRKEAERQRRESAETVEQLNQRLEEERQLTVYPGDPARDMVTGLPTRTQAEAALAEWGRAGKKAYAALFVLDRLQAINLKFGRDVGDSVLNGFLGSVRERLSPTDRLFRWSGTALLALLPRPNTLETVRSELGRILDSKLEHMVQTASRSILLPVAPRWTVFPMMAAPRLIYQKLDAFAAVLPMRD